jgi:general stress protein 26
MTTATKDELEQIDKLITGSRIGVLTTMTEDGRLVSRPLATVDAEFDGDVWFFVSDDSEKVHQIQHDSHVNVSFQSGTGYLSLSGRAQLVHDRAKVDEYWNTAAQAWFTDGKDDPHIALLKVNAESAEYWATTDAKPVALLKYAKAAVTGSRPDVGENHSVSL